jgi:hypothetical protein
MSGINASLTNPCYCEGNLSRLEAIEEAVLHRIHANNVLENN